MTELLAAVLVLGALAALFGLLLGYVACRIPREGRLVTERINALLPQTQCNQCDYPGCRPYAEAIARGEADINRCLPGGEPTRVALADLLERDAAAPRASPEQSQIPRVAVIDEAACIGCTLCLQVCPVDAIVGASVQVHTVIAVACTGCDLCLAPCPVDCIEMVSPVPAADTWRWPRPGLS